MGDFEISDGTLVVNRDLYWELEKEFDVFCERLAESDSNEITLDLTDVGFIFSPYVSRIVKLFSAAQERGKTLKILISPDLKGLFDTAGLTEELDVEVVEG